MQGSKGAAWLEHPDHPYAYLACLTKFLVVYVQLLADLTRNNTSDSNCAKGKQFGQVAKHQTA